MTYLPVYQTYSLLAKGWEFPQKWRRTEALTTPGRFQLTIQMPLYYGFYISCYVPAQGGSSSYLGKHAETMVMDFLATITTHRTYERLDLIDASIQMVVWGYSIHIRFCNSM